MQLSYAIGQARPGSVQVETFGTGTLPDETVAALLQRHVDLRLGSVIKHFNLRLLPSSTKGGLFRKLAAYGHVGRVDLELPWEATDKVEVFKGHRN